jgi:hypothetical protein
MYHGPRPSSIPVPRVQTPVRRDTLSRPCTTLSAVLDEPVGICPFSVLAADSILTHASIPTRDSKVQISGLYELGSQNCALIGDTLMEQHRNPTCSAASPAAPRPRRLHYIRVRSFTAHVLLSLLLSTVMSSGAHALQSRTPSPQFNASNAFHHHQRPASTACQVHHDSNIKNSRTLCQVLTRIPSDRK